MKITNTFSIGRQTERRVRRRKPDPDPEEEILTVCYEKRLFSEIYSEFRTQFRTGLHCDVAIYCPFSYNDDLSSLPTVEEDVWIIPDGSNVGLATNWARIRCHSMVLATLSPMLKRTLLNHSPETPVCSCSCACETKSTDQEMYSIILPDIPAIDVVKLLNQAYFYAATIGKATFKISRDIYQLLELTSDNPLDSDDLDVIESGGRSVVPLGVASSDQISADEQLQRVKQSLERKRKWKFEPIVQINSPKTKNVPEKVSKDVRLRRSRMEAKKRGSKLRVALNRLNMNNSKIDLDQRNKSRHILFIPETVRHVFADILEDISREEKLEEEHWIESCKAKSLDPDRSAPSGNLEESVRQEDCVVPQTEAEMTESDCQEVASDGTMVKRIVLKPISKEEVLANLSKLHNTDQLVLKPIPLPSDKVSIVKDVVYKGYSRANPVMMIRDVDQNEKTLTPAELTERFFKKYLTNPSPDSRAFSNRYSKLATKFSGRQLQVMAKFLGQTDLTFDPVSSTYEYTEEMLDNIVSSSGKISLVTIDHDRNQIFVCPICNSAIEEHGLEAFCKHVTDVHKTKPRIECQVCGKPCLYAMNFLPHTFQHRLLDFTENCTVALLGISSRQNKNIACTLACNREGWSTSNSLFNVMKALEIVYQCSTERLHDLIQTSKKRGKTSGTDIDVAQAKEALEQEVLSPAELQSKLNEMLIRDPNMFEKKSRVRQIFHMPQIPAYAFQVQADFELVSAISFDELSDVAIVLENKQTKQLEVMSTIRMAFQPKHAVNMIIPSNFPLLIIPLLARLLGCSSVAVLRESYDELFQEYFKDYEDSCTEVFALREMLNTVSCHKCERSFHLGSSKGRFLYESHKEMHLFGDDICDCTVATNSGETRLQHMRDIHGLTGDQVPDRCNCKAAFKTVKSKAMHMKNVHGVEVKLYDCLNPRCTMSFFLEKSRDVHVKAGKHQLLTVCDQCGKSFGSNGAWILHRNLYHRPSTCPNCNKTVNGYRRLKSHMIRCEIGTWNCQFCRQVFTSDEDLNAHRLSKHPSQNKKEIVSCTICCKEFNRLQYLRNHEKRVHLRPPNQHGRHVGKTRVLKLRAAREAREAAKQSAERSASEVETMQIEYSTTPITITTIEQHNVEMQAEQQFFY